tara:strand:+ start:81 stop:281 length:201 start_codon:yes stop_codon:yes gene_type:complete
MENETSTDLNEKFKRIAPKRINNFILSADRLIKLSNKAYYEMDEEDKKYVMENVDKVYKELKSKFQ